MKIIVNKDKCCGHARCNVAAPELYELDDVGYISFAEKEVPEGLEERARRGVLACPEGIVELVDDDGTVLDKFKKIERG